MPQVRNTGQRFVSDNQAEPAPVAIETPRGLLVACLRRTRRQIYAINPLSVARYRDRHSVSRAKSDLVDAELFSNILRTDRAAHRPLPADSELAHLGPPTGHSPTVQ